MNKLHAALVAGLIVSSVALAQTTAPAAAPTGKKEMDAEKAKEVQATTTQSANSSTGATTAAQQQKNTAASKKIAKPTTAERAADTKASAVYPQSGPSTAAQAEKNTAISKEMPKQKVNLGTPAAEKAMQKASTP